MLSLIYDPFKPANTPFFNSVLALTNNNMPLRLGENIRVGNLRAHVVEATQLGSAERPVETIHRASTDVFQNDLKFQESTSGEIRAAIRTTGHLAIAQDLELHNSTNVDASDKAWTVGCDSSGNFVIRDEIAHLNCCSKRAQS